MPKSRKPTKKRREPKQNRAEELAFTGERIVPGKVSKSLIQGTTRKGHLLLPTVINPLNHPTCFADPKRLTPFSGWHEHIPFGMFLVDILRPNMIVELGTQYGDSYCAFCQAVKELNLDTRCYGIDSWQGDPHTGFYGSEVLADLRAHHDPLYGSFSCLIQSTFEEALQHFADGTIDILHIDGYHVYEAVKRDLESWLPKLSSSGVVLFHDTNVRERDFGVRRYWDEIRPQYPHFEFLHGHGLGVLAVAKVHSKELQALFSARGEEAATIREFFFQLGHRLSSKVESEAKGRAHEQTIRELQQLVEERTQWAKSLDAELAARRAYLGRLQAEFDEKATWADRLNAQVREHEQTIQQLAEQHAQHAQSLETELRERRAYLQRLQAEFNEKTAWAGQLESQLRESQGGAAQLASQLQEKVSELEAKQNILRELDNSVAECKQRIDILTALWEHTTARKRKLLYVLAPLDWLLGLLLTATALFGRLLRHVAPRIPLSWPPPDTTRCSIVVLSWEGKELLAESLPALLAAVERHRGDHEIIVVDNGSTDGTSEFVRGNFPTVRLVRSPRNIYFTGGNNLGVRAVSRDIVVLLNNDMIVDPDFLAPLLLPFEKADVFAVASQVFIPDRTRPREETGKTRAYFVVSDFEWKHEPISHHDEQQRYVPVFWAGGGAAAFDARKFRWLGGFDTLYDPFYVEDADLSYRGWKAGWRCLLAVHSHVLHKHRATNRPRYGERFVDNTIRRNHYLFLWKNVTDLRKLCAHFLGSTRNRIRRAGIPGIGIRFELRAYARALACLPRVLWKRASAHRYFVRSDQEILDAISHPHSDTECQPEIDLRRAAFDQQLGEGWHDWEQDRGVGYRWMGRRAVAFVRTLATRTACLVVEGYVPPLHRYGTRRLFLSLRGGGWRKKVRLREGPLRVEHHLDGLSPGSILEIELEVSRTLKPTADLRELGIVIHRIALVEAQQGGRIVHRALAPTKRERTRDREPRILFASPYSIYPVTHGGAVRMFNVLKRLSRRHEVHLLTFVDTEEELESNRYLETYCASVTPLLRRPDRSREDWRGLEPAHIWEFRDPLFASRLQDIISRQRINVVQLEYTQLAQYAPKLAGVHRFLTEHDVSFVACRRRMKAARGPLHWSAAYYEYLRMLRYEYNICKYFDAIFTVTEKEGRLLRSILGNSRTRVNWNAPTGTDIEYFQYSPPSSHPRGEVLYVGNFRHSPNVEAVLFLVEEVMPRLCAEWENLKLFIVGSDPPEFLKKRTSFPYVHFLGFVEDLRPLYARCDVLMVPVHQGAGVRVKILEAFAAGIPVVTTTLGAEGIQAEPGRHYLVAHSPEEFASQVLRLLHNGTLRRELSQQAREVVEQHYGWDRIVDQIAKEYESSLWLAQRQPSCSAIT